MQDEPTQITLLVAHVLEKLSIPYALSGSFASSLHGVMRSTLDADILADVRLEHIPAFVEQLSSEFYADEDMMREAIARHGSFNLIHYETSFKVDVFVRRSNQFDQMQLSRRKLTVLTQNPDQSIYVASAEDVILSKLEWYRAGDEISDRQWRDVLGILKTQADDLDFEYLRRWAANLKILDLFEKALKQAS